MIELKTLMTQLHTWCNWAQFECVRLLCWDNRGLSLQTDKLATRPTGLGDCANVGTYRSNNALFMCRFQGGQLLSSMSIQSNAPAIAVQGAKVFYDFMCPCFMCLCR